ncbi:invertase inhibitor [Dorcoceras hygrometricum]|uniref:Invertase inhibitor n=1 Tax=Dorcoceras hygrometricum TaxID=472368 RepID=A0A2Z7AEC6_9LAMI|nr:invertase inhibitor [Dorcoceras hygrometricum]
MVSVGRAVSIAMAFFASAILVSSFTQVAGASSSTPIIRDVCASTGKQFQLDNKFCIETLSSESRIVAATDLVKMSLALIEAAMSNAAKTRDYVKNMLKQPGLKPDHRYVMQQCDIGYSNCYLSFGSALGETQEKEYFTATYDVKIAFTDNVDFCRNALTSTKIQDEVLSRGNNFIYVFGAVAFDSLDRLIG